MKKFKLFPLLLVAGALAGCGEPASSKAIETPTNSPTATSPAPTPTPSNITVSERTTCTLLIGPDEDGPLIKYVNEITSADPTDSTALASLRTLKSEIEDVAKTATPEMKELAIALFSEDVNDFKAAGVELLTRCG